MTNPLNIIFDEFGIWLPADMIESSCKYFSQDLYGFE